MIKKILCVIPSRIGSTRLPKKPLLPINGKPMIQIVYENAIKCDFLEEVIVATDSHEVKRIIENINGKVILTDSNLLTGSDRVAAVAKKFLEMDIIINLQGDEPFVNSVMLEQLISPYLNNENPDMATLARDLDYEKYKNDPGVVKVITDIYSNAIYFSRSAIPYFRQSVIDIDINSIPMYHHIGLYAFKRDFLLKFTNLPMTPLEKIESLEQLRALEHGFKIKVSLTKNKTLEINTLEEYQLAQSFNF